jgi:ABC-2 type transport system permease protein
MTAVRHMSYMALRDLRALWRQPWYVAVTLVQPLIWLLLFGELFKRFPGGVLGVLVLVLVAGLLGASFGALSNSLALVTRQEGSLIGAVTFLVLPLTFLSTALMRHDLLPGWMRTAADVNPVDWAIEAGRSATAASPDWGLVATNTALLAALLAVCATLATRAFRSYQRSV